MVSVCLLHRVAVCVLCCATMRQPHSVTMCLLCASMPAAQVHRVHAAQRDSVTGYLRHNITECQLRIVTVPAVQQHGKPAAQRCSCTTVWRACRTAFPLLYTEMHRGRNTLPLPCARA